MRVISKKIDVYRRKFSYVWSKWLNLTSARKREKKFGAWIDHLTARPPEVLLGANFDKSGGVRHHIHAIQRYSSWNIELAPSEELMKEIHSHHMLHDFNERFSQFPAAGIKVIHSHVSPWFIDWCHRRQKCGVPWIHTYHLNYYPEHSTGELEPWQKEINNALLNMARYAETRLSVSRWQVEELSQEHGISTQYLPNGVDVAMCDEANASRFTNRIGLENFILYVGRNTSVKNPVEFIRLAKRLPNHQFVMIGGDLSNDSLRKDWHLNVPDNLLVIGPLSQNEVQDAIAACSALVVTSKREGLPTLVMEGMTQRKVVVVPNEKGCMEVIGGGEVGFIYQQGNIDDLVEKTLQALADKHLGELARRRVLMEYDWRVVAPKLDAIYQDVTT